MSIIIHTGAEYKKLSVQL